MTVDLEVIQFTDFLVENLLFTPLDQRQRRSSSENVNGGRCVTMEPTIEPSEETTEDPTVKLTEEPTVEVCEEVCETVCSTRAPFSSTP